ncbi:alpha-L-arabinofuranosidase C-terminal domain-containing protein [Sinomonas sp. JGH33]|uniref:non-reducing end alpha-L-arabinofuranosidase n=1 Tax=Sinomonas terricola TaxID=3110330 RepID=A0ABU5T6N8_9MICC|nr:alpha-L-arabinofuranosidase C-terminal domain-containing protein [Sinomonas sp. JGH33]MEA5455243.1 alpha-L-arabinofuranosidase C-terminal domain-containing protein [Sinomonas sp. JGH33]
MASTPCHRLIVNLDIAGPTISRHLYGHFAEHLGRCIYGGFWVGEDSDIPNTRGIRNDVVAALRELNIPNLRWPGGCFADEYHWRDGIGPRDQRPRMVNSHWGDVVEDNSFGTHEFMDLCELLGAEAYVNGNVGSGTVREMSEWIEYLTRDDDSPMAALRRANGQDEPWKVPFFGIGNEPWGCGGHLRAEAYADLARQYSTYVRNHNGNDVYRIAAGANADDVAWTKALMEGLVRPGGPDSKGWPYQGISLHYYTMSGTWSAKGSATEFSDDEYWKTIKAAQHIETLLTAHSTMMDVYDPHKSVGLILDEWGTWWDVEPGTNPGFLYQQNTVRDALVAAIHFDSFHRHADRLAMANIAQAVNVLQAMLLTDPESGALVKTPTFHVFAMNADHQDALALHTHFATDAAHRHEDAALPTLTASASTKDGEVLVSLANLELEEERELVLDFRGSGFEIGESLVLAGDSAASFNAPKHPDAVAPRPLKVRELEDGQFVLVLPPHSFATVRGQVLDAAPAASAAAGAAVVASESKPCLNC